VKCSRAREIEENEFAERLKACDNPAVKALLEVGYRQGLRKMLDA
jgi:hypothetical protein